jgi:hypothetical protein
MNIIIQRDDFGEQKIIAVKDRAITTERVQQIQHMNETEVSKLSTRDKLIWFNHRIDQNTVDFTSGFNEITINRENIIQDSMKYFLDL